MADPSHDLILDFLNDANRGSDTEYETDHEFCHTDTVADDFESQTNQIVKHDTNELFSYDDICRSVEENHLDDDEGDVDLGLDDLEDAFQVKHSKTLMREALRYNLRSQKILMGKLSSIETELEKIHDYEKKLKILKEGPYYAYTTFQKLTRSGNRPMTEVQKWNSIRCLPQMFCAPFFYNDKTGSMPDPLHDGVHDNLIVQYLQSGRDQYYWLGSELDRLRDLITVEYKKYLYIQLAKEHVEVRRLHGARSAEATTAQSKLKSLGAIKLNDLCEIYGDPLDIFTDEMWQKVANEMEERHFLEIKLAWKFQARPGINTEPFTKDERKRVCELVQQHGLGKWSKIADELGNGRTAGSVFRVWKEENVASIPIRAWTKEEDERLLNTLKADPDMPLTEVSRYVDGRSTTQCITRFQKSLEATIRRGRWTKEEDTILSTAVQKFKQVHGIEKPISFQYVSQFIPGRTDASCRERWTSHLNPEIKKGNFTVEEDSELIRLMHQVVFEHVRVNETESYYKRAVGDQVPTIPWSHFAKTSFQGRSDTALKDRYDTIFRNFLRRNTMDLYSEEINAMLERLKEVPWKKWKNLGPPETHKKAGRKRKVEDQSDVQSLHSALDEILGPADTEAPKKPKPRKQTRKREVVTEKEVERNSSELTPLEPSISSMSEPLSTTSSLRTSESTETFSTHSSVTSETSGRRQPSAKKPRSSRFELRQQESVWGKRLRARTMTPTNHDTSEQSMQETGQDILEQTLEDLVSPPESNQMDDFGSLLNDILGEESFVLE